MDVVGRHPLEQELTQHNAILIIYRQQNKKTLCDKLQQKISDNIYVSLFSGLSLCDYVTARTIFCELHHKHPCTQCIPLLSIAKCVLENGHIQLSTAFKQAYPTQKYKTDIAISRLLRMPLICIKPHEQNIWFLFEQVVGLDVLKFFHLTNALFCAKKVTSSLHKSEVQSIMSLAQSDRERELIRYSIFRASGLSYTGARKTFGFEGMKDREAHVMKAIDEARAVSETIDDLANTADLALLHSMGIDISTESDLEFSSSDDESSCIDSELPDLDVLLKVLEAGKYNWFEVRDYLEKTASCDHESPSLTFLTTVFSKLMSSITSPESKILLEQSYNASLATEKEKELENRLVAQLNGEIVSESESDSAVPATMQSPEVKNLIAKKRKNVLRKFKRRKAREIAERRLLSRSVSRRRNTIIDRFPNIGSEIESFVRSCDIGADKWRRTGVLTFDGNVRVNKKVTFQRIKEHLEATYGQKFSYGTVVQLCVARNRRHRAAKNYRGVAKVTSRRARKGFTLKYNPDAHWSSALYRTLDHVQFQDGSNITIINRDDASGFRLDTLATNSQHRTLVVNGEQTLTTHTDYVNRYPSIIQTTSYNFSGTHTTGELCAGVVKPAKVYPKNPAQHYSDLRMLSKESELKPAFTNPLTLTPKDIECVRVDGATDEGPSHLEVQFWWTKRHIEENKIVTLVTSRSSGSSYLNRVELQNGCLALAHANLYIPSTLNGLPFDPSTGSLDSDVLFANLNQAADIYLQRVDKCSCGDTVIQMYKGSNSSEYQQMREKLQIFLKGSKKKKQELRTKEPEIFDHFNEVWKVRENHHQSDLPGPYMFLLSCCYQQDCPHPRCKRGPPSKSLTWFPGGPGIKQSLLPIPDPSRPFGDPNCTACQGMCSGHFLKPEEALESHSAPMSKPPSVIIKDFFNSLKGSQPTDAMVTNIAQKTLLPTKEVQLWIEHLSTVNANRKRGASKAATTRRSRTQPQTHQQSVVTALQPEPIQEKEQEEICGKCGGIYEPETEEEELWIACDVCSMWFHAVCIGFSFDSIPDCYKCEKCN